MRLDNTIEDESFYILHVLQIDEFTSYDTFRLIMIFAGYWWQLIAWILVLYQI